MNVSRKIIHYSSSLFRFRGSAYIPVVSARNVGAYQGHGRTVLDVMNNKDAELLMITSYSQVGFRLQNGILVIGPMIIHKNVVLGWDVKNDQAITEDSLEFFRHLEPPLDLLILGLSEDKSLASFNRELIIQFRKLGLPLEILPSAKAAQMYNFVTETRNVAGALLPPRRFRITTDDYLENMRKFGMIYGPKIEVLNEGILEQQARNMGIKDGSIFWLTLVGLLWGGTNPIVKSTSNGIAKIKGRSKLHTYILQIIFLCVNWKFLVALILNQMGSVVYYFALQFSSLSLCVPVANSSALLCTVISSWLVDEKKMTSRTLMGVGCLTIAIGFFIIDKYS